MCVCVCVHVYNILHMVGTHSPSVSSGSGVFSLPEEGKPIERVGNAHVCTYTLCKVDPNTSTYT